MSPPAEDRSTPGTRSDLPATISVEEAGKWLGIGRNTAYSCVRRGEIPSLRLGRRLVVPTAKLLELLGEERAA
jgi:excisionase family DNA binding protein